MPAAWAHHAAAPPPFPPAAVAGDAAAPAPPPSDQRTLGRPANRTTHSMPGQPADAPPPDPPASRRGHRFPGSHGPAEHEANAPGLTLCCRANRARAGPSESPSCTCTQVQHARRTREPQQPWRLGGSWAAPDPARRGAKPAVPDARPGARHPPGGCRDRRRTMPRSEQPPRELQPALGPEMPDEPESRGNPCDRRDGGGRRTRCCSSSPCSRRGCTRPSRRREAPARRPLTGKGTNLHPGGGPAGRASHGSVRAAPCAVLHNVVSHATL
jgi:hypothetical protein